MADQADKVLLKNQNSLEIGVSPRGQYCEVRRTAANRSGPSGII